MIENLPNPRYGPLYFIGLQVLDSEHDGHGCARNHADLRYHHRDELWRGHIVDKVQKAQGLVVPPVHQVRLLLADFHKIVRITYVRNITEVVKIQTDPEEINKMFYLFL